MARRAYARRRGGRSELGAVWISYTDAMVALLLVFAMVMVFGLYQVHLKLGTRTVDLEQKAALMAAQQQQLDDQQAKLQAQKTVLDAQQTTLNAQ